VGKFFSAFDTFLVIMKQWAAGKRPGGNWRFSVLLKDTSTCNYRESGYRTGYLVVTGDDHLSPLTPKEMSVQERLISP